MKVCLIDPSLFTGPYDHALMGGLRSIGDDVRLYTCALQDDSALSRDVGVVQLFYPQLVKTPFSRLPKVLQQWCKGLGHPTSMRRLSATLAAVQPDVIHFQWLPFPIVDGCFLKRLARIAPVICTVHDTRPFNGSPSGRIQEIGAFAILRRFDALIVHTEQAHRRIKDLGVDAGPVRRISHGPLPVASAIARRSPRSRHDGKSRLEILLFGKLKPYKGVDVLIRALSLLSAGERAECRARVVGKPHMDAEILKKLAGSLGLGEVIEFDFRHVGEGEIPHLLADASVMVLPYREIDASGVLMTAIGAGCPIIATSIGGFAEMLQDGRDAILVPPDDPSALATALRRVIRDSALLPRLAAGIERLRSEIPDWVDIGRSTHRLYEQAVENRRTGGGLWSAKPAI